MFYLCTCSLQFSSVAQSCLILCDPMNCSLPGLPVHHQLPELTQTHVHLVCDAIQPSHPHQPLPFPPSIFPSIRVFSNEPVLHIRRPKYWSIHFSIRPSNEYSGLISCTTDWFDFLKKAMATHPSTLARKIPWTEEPGRLQSMGSLRVRHN